MRTTFVAAALIVAALAGLAWLASGPQHPNAPPPLRPEEPRALTPDPAVPRAEPGGSDSSDGSAHRPEPRLFVALPKAVSETESESRWPPDEPRIAVRLVDSLGQPLARLQGRAFESSTAPRLAFLTDARGAVLWTRNDLHRSLSAPSKLFLELSEEGRLGEGRFDPVELELPGSWPDRPCDLGTLCVDERDLILEGTVSTMTGKPVAACRMVLRGGPDPSGVVRAVADELGRFALHGSIPSGPAELSASFTGFLGKSIMIDLPRRPWQPVHLQLEPANWAEIRGRVLLDEGILPGAVLLRKDGKLIERSLAYVRDGTVRIEWVSPEPVDVVYRVPYHYERVWTYQVHPKPHEVLTLPDLDLRGKLQQWTVIPVDEDGAPGPGLMVFATDPKKWRPSPLSGELAFSGGFVYATLGWHDDGRADITIVTERGSTMDVMIKSWDPSFLPELITLTSSDQEVRVVLRRRPLDEYPPVDSWAPHVPGDSFGTAGDSQPRDGEAHTDQEQASVAPPGALGDDGPVEPSRPNGELGRPPR